MNTFAEVLAPAGSAEAAAAAVRGGADAVYLGYGDFNARRHARNFTLDELRETVRFCHENRVAVHVTLNTLVFAGEEEAALQTAREAASAGADAFIVQDMGLARLLRRELPHIPLHASTQLSVHNAAGVRFLAEQGFRRVVLAREMTGEEIAAVHRDNPETELEAFVHGALCMSVSGQCWFSAFLGGRSGNRGLCAQTCRLPFSCGGKENALSLKDLSLVPHVEELLAAGVVSLKIEGRMKRPEYVAVASRALRNAVDGVKEEEVNGLLRDVFSRSGFTDGYFTGRRGSGMFGVRRKEDAVSSEALGRINALTRTVCSRLPLTVTLTAKRGEPLTLALSCRGQTVTACSPAPEEARTPPDLSRVREALSRFGGTPYFAESIELKMDDGLFLPVSALNDLRRRAVAAFSFDGPTGEASEPPKTEPADFCPSPFTLRCEKPSQIPAAFEGDVWLPLSVLTEETVSALRERGCRVAAELPRFLPVGQEKGTVKKLREGKAWGVTAAVCGNVGHLPLVKEAGLIPLGGFGLNISNAESDRVFREAGVSARTLSFETPLSRLSSFGTKENLLFAYGRVPVMLVRNCPLSGPHGCADCTSHGAGGELIDRKNEHFPVLCRHGHGEILNSRPLWLADKPVALPQLLYFTTETAAEAEEVWEAYREGKPCEGKFTRGMYGK